MFITIILTIFIFRKQWRWTYDVKSNLHDW